MAASAGETLHPVTFDDLPGWTEDDHAAALTSFRRSCAEIRDEGRAFRRDIRFGGRRDDWRLACEQASAATDARVFFEDAFQPFEVRDPQRPEGLFTGYFEPEADGRRHRERGFETPLYAVPGDLVAFDDAQAALAGVGYGRIVDGQPRPYFTRREIEEGALAGRGLEILWLRDPADAFFMQIQGSGRVRLADGEIVRLAYGLKSGLPYTGIGHLLAERGAIARADLSMQSIRAWMAQHPEEARALMWENRSFVFFREIDGRRPGAWPSRRAAGAPHAMAAASPSTAASGPMACRSGSTPSTPTPGGERPLRRLLIAQDTGSAILGLARGDVFFGAGAAAAWSAGHMKSAGSMIVLLPRPLARRLIATP